MRNFLGDGAVAVTSFSSTMESADGPLWRRMERGKEEGCLHLVPRAALLEVGGVKAEAQVAAVKIFAAAMAMTVHDFIVELRLG